VLVGAVVTDANADRTRRRPALGPPTLALLCAVLGFAVAGGVLGDALRSSPRLGTAATVFVSVVVQATPFLVLGVLVSGAVGVALTPERLHRLLPRNRAAAVCVAGLGGVALPGCECGSVPVARRLLDSGVPRAAALSFLLAAPAVNPVVVAATLVAFPGLPQVALARFAASLLTALVVGWTWIALGREEWVLERAAAHVHEHGDHEHGASGSRLLRFAGIARGDLLTSASYLALGAAVVAAVHVLVPAGWAEGIGGHLVTAVLVAAVLAVVLSLCSEADAFVASAMTLLPLLPRLVFLVVGPVVDLKLVVLYAGVLGRRVAVRLVPLAFVVAVASALAVGALVFTAWPTPGAW